MRNRTSQHYTNRGGRRHPLAVPGHHRGGPHPHRLSLKAGAPNRTAGMLQRMDIHRARLERLAMEQQLKQGERAQGQISPFGPQDLDARGQIKRKNIRPGASGGTLASGAPGF
jgi:hypothetical protein